jgi:hypothetical protein
LIGGPAVATESRIGGRATMPSGERLTWSAASGARGTRWREAVDLDGRLIRSLMLEVSPAGRPTRLELTTLEGLLTLHPEPDESAIHGNVVSPSGVRHLALPWSPDDELWIVGSAAAIAVTLARVAGIVRIGETVLVRSLRLDDELVPRQVERRIERRGEGAWQSSVTPTAGGREESIADAAVDIELGEWGRIVLDGAVQWPLEA